MHRLATSKVRPIWIFCDDEQLYMDRMEGLLRYLECQHWILLKPQHIRDHQWIDWVQGLDWIPAGDL